MNHLQRVLSAEELRECVALQGKETTLSQHYPPGLVTEILIGVRELAQKHNPDRFQQCRTTWTVHAAFKNDLKIWKMSSALLRRLSTTVANEQ